MFLITEGGRAPWRKRSMRMRGMVIQIQMASVWAEMGEGTEPRDRVGGSGKKRGGAPGPFPCPTPPSTYETAKFDPREGSGTDLKGGGLWGTRTHRSL